MGRFKHFTPEDKRRYRSTLETLGYSKADIERELSGRRTPRVRKKQPVRAKYRDENVDPGAWSYYRKHSRPGNLLPIDHRSVNIANYRLRASRFGSWEQRMLRTEIQIALNDWSHPWHELFKENDIF